MRKLITQISNYFEKEKFLNLIEKLQDIILKALPENWADNKKSLLLFWFISSFTVIFLIWAYFAQINQVVRASGQVRPDSKIHVIQSANPGPIEAINISLGDKVGSGDILFIVDLENTQQLFDLSKMEVETRIRKVEIIESLVSKGSDSEFRLLDEKLALIEAQKRFDQAKRQLEFSYVRSPVNGLVSSVNTRNIGQVVSSGNLLAEIVPEDDLLKIEAGVQVKDIAYVRIGQKAKISFLSYDMAIYGQLDGVVTKVAANTTQNEDGSSYYPTIIEVDGKSLKDNNSIIIQSGMLCDVSIIGEERTVLSYISNPITKLSMRALQE